MTPTDPEAPDPALPLPLAIDELLEHVVPLRQLARRLVLDEARAEDVVQETWLAALRQPPATGKNPLGWLSTVARNAARRMGRDDGRRRAREEQAAREEAAPPEHEREAEVEERARAQRELTDALLGLDEPYRVVLLYRYFDGLAPRHIAERLGMPVTTVHTRLARGREKLRRALTDRFGERARWCEAFIAWAGAPKLGAPPVPLAPWVAPAAKGAGLVAASATVGFVLTMIASDDRGASGTGEDAGRWSFARGGGATERGHDDEPPWEDGGRGFGRLPVPRGDGQAPDEAGGARHGSGARSEGEEEEESAAEEARGNDRLFGSVTRTFAAEARPPGLVRVEGGTTWIGTKDEDALQLVGQFPEETVLFALETPHHEVEVAEFLLMPTEVTHEQYAPFVEATGAKAPLAWAPRNQVVAEERHFDYLERRREEQALEAGTLYEKRSFDPVRWWKRLSSSSTSGWDVPRHLEETPVTHVTLKEAQAYASWAGLRLVSESEFQHAARRDTQDTWPWGNEWRSRYAHAENEREPKRVGRHRSGAVEGIHDLAGNVWEWTTTKLEPYPEFSAHQLLVPLGPTEAEVFGHRPRDLLSDPLPVVTGGGFDSPPRHCRVSMRRPADPEARLADVGFRCAADPGRARRVRESLDRNRRPPGVSVYEWLRGHLELDAKSLEDRALDLERLLAIERWERKPSRSRVADYELIAAYERVVFAPVSSLNPPAGRSFADAAKDPLAIPLGWLSTPRRIFEPDLAPGSYRVIWVGADGIEGSGGPSFWLPDPALLGFRLPEGGGLLFLTGNEGERNNIAAALPRALPSVMKGAAPRGMDVSAGGRHDILRIRVGVPVRGEGELALSLELRFAAGTFDEAWR